MRKIFIYIGIINSIEKNVKYSSTSTLGYIIYNKINLYLVYRFYDTNYIINQIYRFTGSERRHGIPWYWITRMDRTKGEF